MQSPFETSPVLELRAPQQMQLIVPGAVAFGGLMACLVLNFLPSSTPIMKLAGGVVLLTDLLVAAFLAKMFASRLVRVDESGVTVRGPAGEKSVPWSQLASYQQVAGQGGAYLSLRDASGTELLKIESILGSKEERAQLQSLLDTRLKAR